MSATLYLIPATLGDTPVEQVLPQYNLQIISSLQYFIVENIRTARRFIKKVNPAAVIDDLTFLELNEHTKTEEISGFLAPLFAGNDMGVISEAGCPTVADPGADVVALAQQKNIKVTPLVGPSSILLALMASGFNGQNFAFAGYLPVNQTNRMRAIKNLESKVYSENQTQIFIETPYRNAQMLESLLSACNKSTKLCIAADITLASEFIATKTVSDWKQNLPDLNKKPCLFLIYK